MNRWPTAILLVFLSLSAPALELDTATKRAFTWLAGQQADDGHWGKAEYAVAITGLCILAHLGHGHRPAEPETGLDAAIRWLLSTQQANGRFRDPSSRLYGQGIACLALAESLGAGVSDELAVGIIRALPPGIQLIEQAAQVAKSGPNRGGWHYEITSTNADLSVSAWQLQALYAAQATGFDVDPAVLAAGVNYVRNLIRADGRVGYQKPGEDRSALRGVALACLHQTNEADDAERLERITSRLLDDELAWQGTWFFYRVRAEALGLHLLNRDDEAIRSRQQQIRELLLKHQHRKGWWPLPPGNNEDKQGRDYATAMALLALAAPRNLMPLWSR